jgi:hypothetical protein
LKAYIARIGPLPSNRRQQRLQQRNHPPNLPVDPAANAAPAKEIGMLLQQKKLRISTNVQQTMTQWQRCCCFGCGSSGGRRWTHSTIK